MLYSRKEASGLRLFFRLHRIQVVGGSNPPTPTIQDNREKPCLASLFIFVLRKIEINA